MRNLAAMALLCTAFGAQAQTLDVSVVHGSNEPIRYSFDLTNQRVQIDLREHHNYPVAIHDPSTKKDICREGFYQTGLLLTLRPIDPPAEGELRIEVVGQVSTLDALKDAEKLTCGTGYQPQLTNSPFSDTVLVKPNRKKAVIIDNKYTVLMSVR